MRQLIYLVIVLCCTVQHISAQACCNFESSDCSYNLGYWHWSIPGGQPISPPASFSTHDSVGYIWSQNGNSEATTANTAIHIDNQFTYISFDYYYSNSNFDTGSYLHIYFIPNGSPFKFPLLETSIPSGVWISERVPCTSGTTYCCGLPGASCDGRIEILAILDQPYYDALFAVDNIGTCDTVSKCCTMSDSLTCGFDNSVLNDNYWLFSVTSIPVNPPPNPATGAYTYFEVVANKALDDINSDFVSDEIAIPAAITFQANVFVNVESSNPNNGLNIRFRESTTGLSTDLIFIPTTYGTWLDISFSCGGTNYDCCVSQPTCSGSIIVSGHVEGLGETVLYALNRIGQYPC